MGPIVPENADGPRVGPVGYLMRTPMRAPMT